jgi:hypothetical protein
MNNRECAVLSHSQRIVGIGKNKMDGDKEVVMSIRHQSTDVAPDPAPVADIMGSRETVYTGARSSVSVPVEREVVVSGRSFGLIVASFLAVLLSAWAGIIPYVGPTFGFSADGTSSWTWNSAHTYGALVPGAVGIIFSMLILAGARRPVDLQPAGTLAGAGFVVFLCGAWLSVVPVVWPVIAAPYFHAASPSMTLAHWLGYASGPGILLAAFGAYVMGRSRGAMSVSRRRGA